MAPKKGKTETMVSAAPSRARSRPAPSVADLPVVPPKKPKKELPAAEGRCGACKVFQREGAKFAKDNQGNTYEDRCETCSDMHKTNFSYMTWVTFCCHSASPQGKLERRQCAETSAAPAASSSSGSTVEEGVTRFMQLESVPWACFTAGAYLKKFGKATPVASRDMGVPKMKLPIGGQDTEVWMFPDPEKKQSVPHITFMDWHFIRLATTALESDKNKFASQAANLFSFKKKEHSERYGVEPKRGPTVEDHLMRLNPELALTGGEGNSTPQREVDPGTMSHSPQASLSGGSRTASQAAVSPQVPRRFPGGLLRPAWDQQPDQPHPNGPGWKEEVRPDDSVSMADTLEWPGANDQDGGDSSIGDDSMDGKYQKGWSSRQLLEWLKVRAPVLEILQGKNFNRQIASMQKWLTNGRLDIDDCKLLKAYLRVLTSAWKISPACIKDLNVEEIDSHLAVIRDSGVVVPAVTLGGLLVAEASICLQRGQSEMSACQELVDMVQIWGDAGTFDINKDRKTWKLRNVAALDDASRVHWFTNTLIAKLMGLLASQGESKHMHLLAFCKFFVAKWDRDSPTAEVAETLLMGIDECLQCCRALVGLISGNIHDSDSLKDIIAVFTERSSVTSSGMQSLSLALHDSEFYREKMQRVVDATAGITIHAEGLSAHKIQLEGMRGDAAEQAPQDILPTLASICKAFLQYERNMPADMWTAHKEMLHECILHAISNSEKEMATGKFDTLPAALALADDASMTFSLMPDMVNLGVRLSCFSEASEQTKMYGRFVETIAILTTADNIDGKNAAIQSCIEFTDRNGISLREEDRPMVQHAWEICRNICHDTVSPQPTTPPSIKCLQRLAIVLADQQVQLEADLFWGTYRLKQAFHEHMATGDTLNQRMAKCAYPGGPLPLVDNLQAEFDGLKNQDRPETVLEEMEKQMEITLESVNTELAAVAEHQIHYTGESMSSALDEANKVAGGMGDGTDWTQGLDVERVPLVDVLNQASKTLLLQPLTQFAEAREKLEKAPNCGCRTNGNGVGRTPKTRTDLKSLFNKRIEEKAYPKKECVWLSLLKTTLLIWRALPKNEAQNA